ncbi:InlB B-repeat-containing protein, partial [Candidatus Saccharibacteria bacterium]|nr:InlB B-repeat-containing protein [Candidatus Saccharibacteria bacterium]
MTIFSAAPATVDPTSGTYRYGQNLTLASATRSGYDFLGWFTASTGGTQVTSSTTVTAAATYWAHWQSSDPWAGCSTTAGQTCTVAGTVYVRLSDGKLYTKNPVATSIQWPGTSSSGCPTGTHLPTTTEVINLLVSYGG